MDDTMETHERAFDDGQSSRQQPTYDDLVTSTLYLRQTLAQMANEKTESDNTIRTLVEQVRMLQEQQARNIPAPSSVTPSGSVQQPSPATSLAPGPAQSVQ